MEVQPQQRLSRLQTAEILFVELLKVVLVATVVIVLVRHFLFKPFRVEGASMVPSFHEKEYLIIDELTYRIRPPERGEAVVFRYPLNPQTYYLKRVIGLPGERVSLEGGKIVVFNSEYPQGMVVKEDYINAPKKFEGAEVVTLQDDEYFLMGDNRDNSYDSRSFGPVKKELIVGRVWFRGLPISKIGLVESASYSAR